MSNNILGLFAKVKMGSMLKLLTMRWQLTCNAMKLRILCHANNLLPGRAFTYNPRSLNFEMYLF